MTTTDVKTYNDLKSINNFKRSLEFTLKWEGGYVNDSKDPGGETKWGISKRAYPDLDIKNLTPEQAANIYAKDYWVASGCEDISFPYSAAVFDTAVNCGVGRAKDWLRKAEDVEAFLRMRTDHYTAIINKNTNLMKFAKGWWKRVADLKIFVRINQED